jgi:ribokinase
MEGRRPQVTVVGSYVTDLMCRTPRMPVPGETVFAGPFKLGPGGKGSNQAVAARRAGAEVTLLTKLGRDVLGEYAREAIAREGIDTRFIAYDEELATGAALIMVDAAGQNMITVSTEACEALSAAEVRAAAERIASSDVLLTQFEGSLVAMAEAIAIARRAGRRVIVNPAPVRPVDPAVWRGAFLLTPNETEAEGLSGIPVRDEASAVEAARAIHGLGVEYVIVTLGEAGALVFDGTAARLIPAVPVETVDTTGAGDAFSGALATALAEGRDVWEAAGFAVCAAALSVTRVGTAPGMPYRPEIEALYRSVSGADAPEHVAPADQKEG